MKKYLKYSWTVVLSAAVWILLVRMAPKAWSESMVAIVVSFVAFLILIYNLQIFVAKNIKSDENRSNIIFAQVVPPVLITVIILMIGVITDGDAFIGMKSLNVIFNPFVYAFLIITWGISAGVAASGLNNALRDQGIYEEHKDDKWLGGDKLKCRIGIVLIIAILVGSFASLIFSGRAFNKEPDVTEKLNKVEAAVLEDKEPDHYPYFYGGAYWSHREFEENVKPIYVHPIIQEEEEDYCLVFLVTRMDVNDDFVEKLKREGEKREITILMKKCDFSMKTLQSLEAKMNYRLKKYIKQHPYSNLAKEDSVYRYPGIVSIDVEKNRVCINIPSYRMLDEAKKLFGRSQGMIYVDQTDYNDGEKR